MSWQKYHDLPRAGEDMSTSKPIPKELATLVAVQPLLEALPQTARVQLIASATLMAFDAGEIIIRENEKNLFLYLLLKGEAKAMMNGTPAGRLEPGDVAGEISAIGMSPPIASVIADTDVEAVAFPAESILQAFQIHSEFASRLRKAAFKRVTG
jgi:CRP-like cAMP-binding protein